MAGSGSGGLPARRFSTGNVFLDRRIDGGIPIRDILVLVAPPTSQSEVMFREMVGTRDSLVLSTSGADEAELAERYASVPGTVRVQPVTTETLLASPREVASLIEPETYVVFDAVNAVERAASREQYLGLLSALKKQLRETDSVAVFHALAEESEPPGRMETLQRGDHVWRLEQRVDNRSISYRLLVTKSRGYRALDEPIPLLLTDRVQIDTSFSI